MCNCMNVNQGLLDRSERLCRTLIQDEYKWIKGSRLFEWGLKLMLFISLHYFTVKVLWMFLLIGDCLRIFKGDLFFPQSKEINLESFTCLLFRLNTLIE